MIGANGIELLAAKAKKKYLNIQNQKKATKNKNIQQSEFAGGHPPNY